MVWLISNNPLHVPSKRDPLPVGKIIWSILSNSSIISYEKLFIPSEKYGERLCDKYGICFIFEYFLASIIEFSLGPLILCRLAPKMEI